MIRSLSSVVLAAVLAAFVVIEAPRLLPKRVHATEGQLREVASIFNAAAPGGLGILDVHGGQPTGGYTPVYGTSALRVNVQLATTGTLAMTTKGGATTKTAILNGGATLTAGYLYTFTCGVRAAAGAVALTYDFVLGTDGSIDVFQVEEVFGPVAYPSPAQGGSGTATVAGDVTVVGKAADGAAASGNPHAIAGVDSGALVQALRVDALGRLSATTTLSFLDETVARISPTTSDGTNTVTLVSATAGQIVYPTTLVLYNSHASTTHTVTLLSGSGGGTELLKLQLAAGAGFALDGRGDVQTLVGQALVLKLAAAGTDVVVSGAAVKR